MAYSDDPAVRKARNNRSPQEKKAAWDAAFERNIRTRKAGRRGEMNRSVLDERRVGPFMRYLHATKGWRQYRVEAEPRPTKVVAAAVVANAD